MARIFYFTATGEIYGVHPGPFPGSLPPGVDHIDVPQPPNAIPWPGSPSGTGERHARVQGGALVSFTRPGREPESDTRLAIRAIANEIGPAAKARVIAILGPEPVRPARGP